MSFEVTKKWSKQEFTAAEVWDERCRTSLIKLGNAIYANPGVSFSAAAGETLRQCGTRIFSKETMNPESIQAGHYLETGKRASKHKEILVVQDTSSFNYTSHKATTGLGQIGTDKRSQGINVHTCMVLRADGLPLGIIGQKLWVRKPEESGKRHKRKELQIEQKESYKWIEGLHYANERLSRKIADIWVISDRESDVYEYMGSKREPNINLLIRAVQPRITEAEIEGSKYRGQLQEIIAKLPEAATKTIKIDRGNKTETVTLAISYSNIILQPPAVKSKELKPLPMTVIHVRAKVGKEEKEPSIEWILLSSKQNLTVAEALKQVEFYTHRWKIERFHYTLKTGIYDVEKLQFDDGQTLMNALSFYSVLAWRAMYLIYYGRLEPKAKAEEIIDSTEKEILEAQIKKKITTALEVLMVVGALGGFLGGTKRYPNPGIKTIWIGFIKLEAMKQGWLLAKSQFAKFYATG